jgi:hypothetical protein
VWRNWCSAYRWRERAAGYDNYTDKLKQAELMKAPAASTGTKVRLTFEDEVAPAAEVDSSRYIEGTITREFINGDPIFTLDNITYGIGLSSTQGAGPITGTVVGSEVVFAFTGMNGYVPNYDGAFDADEKPLHANEWIQRPNETLWEKNSEYKIGGATDIQIEKRSALVYLVLDASISLDTTRIGQIRDEVNTFINLIYDRINQ